MYVVTSYIAIFVLSFTQAKHIDQLLLLLVVVVLYLILLTVSEKVVSVAIHVYNYIFAKEYKQCKIDAWLAI